MEIDSLQKENRCYGCGEVGHFRRACPKGLAKKVNVRALWLDLDPDEQQEMISSWEGQRVAEDSEHAPVEGDDDGQKDFY
jgi:hypothetical protein